MMVPARPFLPALCALLAAGAAPAAAQKALSATPTSPRPLAGPSPSGGWFGGSDDCATPTPISGTGTFNFDTSAASTGAEGQNELLCGQTGAAGIDLDVWFEWTAPFDGTAVIDTCGGAGFDTKIAVYDGALGCPLDGTALACNDDVCDVQTATAWTALANNTYLIQVGSFPGAAGGAGSFDIELNTVGGTLGFYTAGTAGSPATAPDPTTQGWSFTALGNVSVTDVSPDGATGLNAWQVDDADPTPPGSLFYEQLFGPEAVAVGRLTGWELRSVMRLVAAPSYSVFMEYSTGTGTVAERYHLWFREAGSDVEVRVLGAGGPTYTCTNANDGAYHSFVLRKPPGQLNLDAEFEYDGAVLGPVEPASGTAANADGGVRWGATNDANVGSANWNELTFAAGAPLTGAPYCFGDGSGNPCPCGNEAPPGSGGGCANSTGSGGVLDGTGSNSVGADDLVLFAQNLLPNQPALLFVGSNAPGMGNGVLFGDGLRCAGMGVERLGVRVPDPNGDASWGPGLGSQATWSPGDQRFFQGWYRNPSGSPCGSGFNLTNGFRVTFQP